MMNMLVYNFERIFNGWLIFLDNEFGLFYGYCLLDKYVLYYWMLLDFLCVFRNFIVCVIECFYYFGSVGEELNKMFF